MEKYSIQCRNPYTAIAFMIFSTLIGIIRSTSRSHFIWNNDFISCLAALLLGFTIISGLYLYYFYLSPYSLIEISYIPSRYCVDLRYPMRLMTSSHKRGYALSELTFKMDKNWFKVYYKGKTVGRLWRRNLKNRDDWSLLEKLYEARYKKRTVPANNDGFPVDRIH